LVAVLWEERKCSTLCRAWNACEKIIHAETLRQYNIKVEFGRARLSNVSTGLPAVLWWVAPLAR
jgi:hypothetical protein